MNDHEPQARHRSGARIVAAALICLAAAVNPLSARTITLTAVDCDKMAVISAKTPRLGWACLMVNNGAYYAETQVQLYNDMAILMQFSLAKIPKDQRITKAEFTMPVNYLAGTKCEVSVRRLLADWGNGVCHQYRRTTPEKVEWAKPGGRGASTDRHNKDTGVFVIEKVGDFTIDVTEDVELWYTSAAPNRGWILTIETASGPVYTASPNGPLTGGSKSWKLNITYEPR